MNLHKGAIDFCKRRSNVGGWSAMTDLEFSYAKMMYELPSHWRRVDYQVDETALVAAKKKQCKGAGESRIPWVYYGAFLELILICSYLGQGMSIETWKRLLPITLKTWRGQSWRNYRWRNHHHLLKLWWWSVLLWLKGRRRRESLCIWHISEEERETNWCSPSYY